MPADVLAEENVLALPEGAKSRQLLTDVVGLDAGSWVGDRLTDSYGSIGRLYGVKYLDTEGLLWYVRFDKVSRYDRIMGRNGLPLHSTRRISQKRTIPFDLFGPVWGHGDEQRRALAAALAESLTGADTPVDLDVLYELAAQALRVPGSADLEEWTINTIRNITDYPMRPNLPESCIKREARIFLMSLDQPTKTPPCGWPAA